jgi:hypothetical protein
VFASPTMKGKQPLWPETLWRRYGRPAVKAAKIQKRVGFHTFRHYSDFRTIPGETGIRSAIDVTT